MFWTSWHSKIAFYIFIRLKFVKNKFYIFGQYFIFRKYQHNYREIIDNFFWLCQCKLNDLPSDKIFVIIKESEYCSNWGEQCEFKLQLPVLLSKLAQQHICCDTHFIAQCNLDGTICSAMFVECPAMRFSYSILKWSSATSNEWTIPKNRDNIVCCLIHLKDIVQSPILQWHVLFVWIIIV